MVREIGVTAHLEIVSRAACDYLAVFLAARIDPATVAFVNPRADHHRLAADLAVFEVGLVGDRGVDQDRDRLAAIRALDGGFDEDIHAGL